MNSAKELVHGLLGKSRNMTQLDYHTTNQHLLLSGERSVDFLSLSSPRERLMEGLVFKDLQPGKASSRDLDLNQAITCFLVRKRWVKTSSKTLNFDYRVLFPPVVQNVSLQIVHLPTDCRPQRIQDDKLYISSSTTDQNIPAVTLIVT